LFLSDTIMPLQKSTLGYILVLLSALLWGSTAAVVKILLVNLDTFQLLLMVSLFCSTSLFIVVLLQKKLPIIKAYKAKDYHTFALMGLIGIFLYTLLLYRGLSLMSAQEAFIINYLWPVMVMVFSALILKEKLTFKKIAGITISFFGIFVVISKGNLLSLRFDSPLGITCIITGAVLYGLFSVLDKKHDYEKVTSIMFYYAFCFIYTLAAVLLFSKIPAITFQQFLGLLWLGGIVNGISTIFFLLSLKLGDTVKMSNVVLVTPFISLVYIRVMTGEQILLPSVIGLIIIVSGILVQTLRRKGKNL